jgi:hypothetical protein
MVALWRMLLGVFPASWWVSKSTDMLLKLIVLKKLLLAALLFLLALLALGGSRHYQQLPVM